MTRTPLQNTLEDLEAYKIHQDKIGGTMRSSFSIAQDTIFPGKMEFTLYSDDGDGNGDHIFTVHYEDLITMIRKYHEEQVS